MLDLYLELNGGPDLEHQKELMTVEHPTVIKARKDNEELQDGLIEVADMAANNEVSASDIQDALVELASMITEIMEG